MENILKFLNSGLGLLLVGAVLGATGLFTWQRLDWIFKEDYLRAQVMLDRKIQLVETINSDAGALVARADSVIAVILKQAPADQRSKIIDIYNAQQAEWFGVTAAHEALLRFYYRPNIAEAFVEHVRDATNILDANVYNYTKQDTDGNLKKAYEASARVRRGLQEWNDLALKYLQSR